MNTLETVCFKYDGSDDSKNIIRIMNKNHRSDFKGNDKYFYWIANNIADTFYKMDKDLTEIPPYEYLALLTGKQLTEGDLIVKEDMICPITKKHCDDECCTVGSICNVSGNQISDLLPTQESVKERNGDPSMDEMIQLVEQLESDKFHLQQQLNTLTSEIKRFQEKYDENGYDCSNEIKLLRIENHIDSTLSFYHKEVTDLQQQLKEAKELLTLFADAKGVYQDNINKVNQFLTSNQ